VVVRARSASTARRPTACRPASRCARVSDRLPCAGEHRRRSPRDPVRATATSGPPTFVVNNGRSSVVQLARREAQAGAPRSDADVRFGATSPWLPPRGPTASQSDLVARSTLRPTPRPNPGVFFASTFRGFSRVSTRTAELYGMFAAIDADPRLESVRRRYYVERAAALRRVDDPLARCSENHPPSSPEAPRYRGPRPWLASPELVMGDDSRDHSGPLPGFLLGGDPTGTRGRRAATSGRRRASLIAPTISAATCRNAFRSTSTSPALRVRPRPSEQLARVDRGHWISLRCSSPYRHTLGRDPTNSADGRRSSTGCRCGVVDRGTAADYAQASTSLAKRTDADLHQRPEGATSLGCLAGFNSWRWSSQCASAVPSAVRTRGRLPRRYPRSKDSHDSVPTPSSRRWRCTRPLPRRCAVDPYLLAPTTESYPQSRTEARFSAKVCAPRPEAAATQVVVSPSSGPARDDPRPRIHRPAPAVARPRAPGLLAPATASFRYRGPTTPPIGAPARPPSEKRPATPRADVPATVLAAPRRRTAPCSHSAPGALAFLRYPLARTVRPPAQCRLCTAASPSHRRSVFLASRALEHPRSSAIT